MAASREKMADAVAKEYTTSLADLTFNSKPHINALTMLAEEYLPHADVIVHVIEAKLNKAHSSGKLPLMYLMDSIVKNVGGNYTPLFAKNIVKNFYSTFSVGDEKIKMCLYKLRSTWDNYFPLKRLYDLDVAVRGADPNWPVKPLPASLQDKPSTSIHVNPKFLKKAESNSASTSYSSMKAPVLGANGSVDLKQDLINKQKQLLELEQQKLLLELEQTRRQLALRERRNLQAKMAEITPADPRVKPATSATKPPNLRVTLPNGQKQAQAQQAAKDPRIQPATKSKQTVTANSKRAAATPDPRSKNEVPKKLTHEPEKSKAVVKKSPVDGKKKKASPNNGTKTLKGAKTPSPKNSTRTDATKKSKIVAKKKVDSKAAKKLITPKDEAPKTERTDSKGPTKIPVNRDAPKKRDRPVRRSPPRSQAPPAKQPRRSTSIERRRSPPPPRRNPDFMRNVPRQRPVALREEELRRESPRSNEGSISPRFSPEPDEGSPANRGQNWRPPIKRARQHEPPSHWRPDDRMPARNVPPMMRRSSVDTNLRIPQELTLSHQAEILKQAEIQLQTGQLTHMQHQDLLKQLHLLFELQRLRNLQQHGDGHLVHEHDRPRLPLDELLPEHHEADMRLQEGREFMHDPMQRQDENRPPPFRPPPSPPQMDLLRGKEDFHPQHTRHLTPPPMPPVDPRQKRPHPIPRREDPRFHNEHGDFQHHHHPDFGDGHENPRMRRAMEDRPLLLGRRPPSPDRQLRMDRRPSPDRQVRMDRRPSPDRPPRGDRRPSPGHRRGSWENPPHLQRTEFGEDLGSVFVLEEEEEFHPHMHQDQPRQDDGKFDLQNGRKPIPERVPLREYAHPDKNDSMPEDIAKRRRSLEERGRHPQPEDEEMGLLRHHHPADEERGRHPHPSEGERGRHLHPAEEERSLLRHPHPADEERGRHSQLTDKERGLLGHPHPTDTERVRHPYPAEEERGLLRHPHPADEERVRHHPTDEARGPLRLPHPAEGESGLPRRPHPAVEERGLLRHPHPAEEERSLRRHPHSSEENEPPFSRRSPPKMESEHIEDESEGGRFEESGEEAYNEHSMKLKRGQNDADRAYREHKKNILVSKYTKKLAAESLVEKMEVKTEQPDNNEKISATTSKKLLVESVSSPDVSKRDKLEEEVDKSPSLPLKKRKYPMSPSSDVRDSSDGGNVLEQDAESLDVSKNDAPLVKVAAEEKHEQEEFEESGVQAILQTVQEEGDKRVTEKDEDHGEEKPGSSSTLDKEGEGAKPASVEKTDDDTRTLKEPTEGAEKQEELDKGSEVKAKNPPDEPGTSEIKKFDVKKEPVKKSKKRKKSADVRLQRIKQLAMSDMKEDDKPGKKNVEKGRRGKPPPASRGRRVEEEKYAKQEEERLRGFMLEEEERLRWEAELEMQLGREEYEDRMQRGKRGSPPPRRGWGRGENGPWRGRGGRPGRGWGRGREFWNEEPPFRGGPPRPGRMLPRHRGEPVDDRDWDRPWDDRRPGPMRRPIPGHPGDRMNPHHPDERMDVDRVRGPPHSPPHPIIQPGAQPQAELNQVNVNKLLSDLLTMGIIPGPAKKVTEGEKAASAPQSPQASNVIESTAPKKERSLTPDLGQKEINNLAKANSRSLETNRVPTPVFEDLLTLDPDANLPNVTLDDVDKLKIRHEDLIKRLYTGIQCSACGMRFTACQTDMYAEHLDWHYRLNRKDKDGVKETHRMLYPTAGDWIMYEEIVDPSQRARNEIFDEAEMEEENNQMDAANEQQNSEELVVPVARNPEQDKCAVCNEAFKTVYNDEDEEWQYVNCVAVEDKNFHPSCYADHNDNPDQDPLPTPVRVPLYNPMVASLKGIPGLDSLLNEAAAGNDNEENAADTTDLAGEMSGEAEPELADTADAMEETSGEAEPEQPGSSEETTVRAEFDEPTTSMETATNDKEREENSPALEEGTENVQPVEKEDHPGPSAEDDSASKPVQDTEEERAEDDSKVKDENASDNKEVEEESAPASTKPSTSESQDSVTEQNLTPPVKLEKIEEVADAFNQMQSVDEQPFVNPFDAAKNSVASNEVSITNNRFESVGVEDNLEPPELVIIDSQKDCKTEDIGENEVEMESVPEYTISAESASAVSTPIKNEPNAVMGATLEPFANEISSNFKPVEGDEPPPPGTEPALDFEAGDENFDSGSDDEDLTVTV